MSRNERGARWLLSIHARVTLGSRDAWADATGNLFVRRTARPVALSGRYEEFDKVKGNKIRLCGEGGRSKDRKMQVKDEEYTCGNKASQNTMRSSEPIRIIRRYKLDSKHTPRNGFRYDGTL
ncbi:hypothetical protein IW261DRAFT_1577216 [Armillaria novae-zelandiae]|uniref:YDG domain-containing protein n=1 Tax=Armillaria novae-zelandiae TaxID=153914 RepID=A0AA39N8B3_9AGAR|nr:hypothetical protein IW261DRAFT_1577216 [Armillaria novae-zelandiae]